MTHNLNVRRRKSISAPSPLPEAEDARAALVREWSRLRQLRAEIEDTVHNVIGLLDRIDPDPDLEDGGDAEPWLGAPETFPSNGQCVGTLNHSGTQVGWARGCDDDREMGDDNGIADDGGLAEQHKEVMFGSVEDLTGDARDQFRNLIKV
jgi:hypothetical protein